MKNYSQSFSFRGLFKSFKNAFRGFTLLFKFEYNLYIQITCAIAITLLGFYFEISFVEWALQTTAIGLVIFSELTNTAIEKIMDFIHPEYNERVRDIKDLASGAVLFTVLIALAIAVFIYIPKIF